MSGADTTGYSRKKRKERITVNFGSDGEDERDEQQQSQPQPQPQQPQSQPQSQPQQSQQPQSQSQPHSFRDPSPPAATASSTDLSNSPPAASSPISASASGQGSHRWHHDDNESAAGRDLPGKWVQYVSKPILFCRKCDLPVVLYGRLNTCGHAFCYDCARYMTTCHICDRAGHGLRKVKAEELWVCQLDSCFESFMNNDEMFDHMQRHNTRQPSPKKLQQRGRSSPTESDRKYWQQSAVAATSSRGSRSSEVHGESFSGSGTYSRSSHARQGTSDASYHFESGRPARGFHGRTNTSTRNDAQERQVGYSGTARSRRTGVDSSGGAPYSSRQQPSFGSTDNSASTQITIPDDSQLPQASYVANVIGDDVTMGRNPYHNRYGFNSNEQQQQQQSVGYSQTPMNMNAQASSYDASQMRTFQESHFDFNTQYHRR